MMLKLGNPVVLKCSSLKRCINLIEDLPRTTSPHPSHPLSSATTTLSDVKHSTPDRLFFRHTSSVISWPLVVLRHPIANPQYACFHTCQHYHVKYKTDVKKPGKDPSTYAFMVPFQRLLDKFEGGMEKKYPVVHKMYMRIKLGMAGFTDDFKNYYKVSVDLYKDKPLSEFTRLELENYRQFPTFVWKLSPILILSSLPGAKYILFPIAFFFPRQLLCHHFWTPEHRVEFSQYYLKQRIPYFESVIQYLKKRTHKVKENQNQRKHWEKALHKMTSGSCLSSEDILLLKPLFDSSGPFGLDRLSSMNKIHTRNLGYSLQLTGFFVRRKLPQQVNLFRHIDQAMHREGLDKLTVEEVRQSCFQRGLDASSLSRLEMEKYLSTWLAVSTRLDESALSLLLHTPSFIAFNHPANSKHRSTDLDEENH